MTLFEERKLSESEKIKYCEKEIRQLRYSVNVKVGYHINIDNIIITYGIIEGIDSLIDVLDDIDDVNNLSKTASALLDRIYNMKTKGESVIDGIEKDIENFELPDTVYEDIMDSVDWYLG